MVAVNSTMLPLGTEAPDFVLPDTITGKEVCLDEFEGSKAYWIMFICNHCPFVDHISFKLAELAQKYQKLGVCVLAICSNNIQEYPDDSPEKMKQEAQEKGYVFPYLWDESQEVAKAYKAACTPDFYVFDANKKLAYRGQFDDSRPSNEKPVTGKDLSDALDAALQQKAIPESSQKPSIGCNIKWKAGSAPAYFKG